MKWSGSRVSLQSAHDICVQDELKNSVATCLAAAFGSGLWASSPMPVGDDSERHSAHGIISELGENAQILVASDMDDNQPLLGCVVGGVLDENLIAAYGLAGHGAKTGDGLLAYIGVPPSAQGCRLTRLRDNVFEILPNRNSQRHERGGDSLAGLLFAQWLRLPAIERSPHVFVRTRKVIGSVIHLIEKNGFEYSGRLDLDFQGDKQDRLVYRRSATRDFSQSRSRFNGQG